jgi:hypothetical protein
MDGSASRIRSTRESSEDCARRLHDKRSIAWPNVSSHRYIMLTKEELVAEIAQVENETILLYEPMITLTATLHRPNGESCVVSKQTFKIPKLIL